MYQVADELLEEYTSKNRCFAFFLEFEKELRLKYHLYDKAFVEYHTDPGQKIMIHFSLDGEHYEQSLLNEVYDGVFVKEFVLFFGESVLYYMTEQEKAEEKITESACLNCRNVPDEESPGPVRLPDSSPGKIRRRALRDDRRPSLRRATGLRRARGRSGPDRKSVV